MRYNISLNIQRRHVSLFFFMFIYFIIWANTAFPQAFSQEFFNNLKELVVSITVETEYGVENHGFGIVVSDFRDVYGLDRSSASVLIITANHIVRDSYGKNITKNIKVRYYSDKFNLYDAALPDMYDKTYDLAFIAADKPENFETVRLVLGNENNLKFGNPVWFIGRSGRWFLPRTPGEIKSVNNGNSILINNLDILPGTSGAPLISSTGIIGMIISDESRSVSKAISIFKIRQVVRMTEVQHRVYNGKLPWHLYYSDAAMQDFSIDDLPGTKEGFMNLLERAFRPGRIPYEIFPPLNIEDLRAVYRGKYAKMALTHYIKQLEEYGEDPNPVEPWEIDPRIECFTTNEETGTSPYLKNGLLVYAAWLWGVSPLSCLYGFFYVNGHWVWYQRPISWID